MHPHSLRMDRERRTRAVIEILRRRAALRATRGEPVPAALRQAIEAYGRDTRPTRHRPR